MDIVYILMKLIMKCTRTGNCMEVDEREPGIDVRTPGTSYNKNQSGTLRHISQESLDDLQKYLRKQVAPAPGKNRKDSAEKAKELNIDFKEGKMIISTISTMNNNCN